jgi:predicted acylesterase/phospholipase RssA
VAAHVVLRILSHRARERIVSTNAGDRTDTAPQLQCDLIMKGGISSGIVYPRAACRLAKKYTFRRLGGASAGAISAAAAAAAEYGRSSGGFERLATLPTDLGTHLADLFQPSSATKPAFALLSNWLEPNRKKPRKLGETAIAAVRSAPVPFVLVSMIMLLPVLGVVIGHRAPETMCEWLGTAVAALTWIPVAAAIVLIVTLIFFALRTLRALPHNGFGLCDGHTRDLSVAYPPLTDWLADTLDGLAGLPQQAKPLTFGDLWGEEAVALAKELKAKPKPSFEERLTAREGRAIDLEVMTTNLTFRRPYTFPFSTRIFYFCEKRMRVYFPDYVVDHLVRTSRVAVDVVDAGTTIRMQCTCHHEQVRSLPDQWDVPVVMAARLSLSFPTLISAVPLFCVDWARGPGKRTLIETWFSDGGISSNFPMHLFDSLWPTRPTFGINLTPQHPDYDSLVWVPRPQGRGGILPRSYETTSVVGLYKAIFDTMQNWVDTTQITMPGFRDRIATVLQRPGEGGMNLKMTADTIECLADRGAEAAALFDDFNFDLHRWIRYRVAMSELDDTMGALRKSYLAGTKGFIENYAPAATRYPVGSQQAVVEDRWATAGLMGVADAWTGAGHPSSAGTVPRPKPSLRLTPRQ